MSRNTKINDARRNARAAIYRTSQPPKRRRPERYSNGAVNSTISIQGELVEMTDARQVRHQRTGGVLLALVALLGGGAVFVSQLTDSAGSADSGGEDPRSTVQAVAEPRRDMGSPSDYELRKARWVHSAGFMYLTGKDRPGRMDHYQPSDHQYPYGGGVARLDFAAVFRLPTDPGQLRRALTDAGAHTPDELLAVARDLLVSGPALWQTRMALTALLSDISGGKVALGQQDSLGRTVTWISVRRGDGTVLDLYLDPRSGRLFEERDERRPRDASQISFNKWDTAAPSRNSR